MDEADSGTAERRDAFATRLFEATLGAFDLLAIKLGLDLGLYDALRRDGQATSAELAARAGIDGRYAREWLEHQAVAGVLDVVEPADDAAARAYALSAGVAEVLLDPENLMTMAPIAGFLLAGARTWPQLLNAYRTGRGVDWGEYPGLSEAQEAINRPAYKHLLTTEWLPSIADIHERLQAGARVADIAAGAGWSSIAMARAYPAITVDAIDLDAAAVDRGRANAEAAGVADRVTFHAADAADPKFAGQFDLVTIFESVHDFSRPVEVLNAVGGLLKSNADLLIMDERVAETFTAPGDEVERLMYGYSLLFCLPNGLAQTPSAATGTVMRPDILRRYCEQAGFSSFTILPIENDFFRFYRIARSS